MTAQEAVDNLGKPFKVMLSTGNGLASLFDTIMAVGTDGIIYGKFIEAHVRDCRLKQPLPAGFKKDKIASR